MDQGGKRKPVGHSDMTQNKQSYIRDYRDVHPDGYILIWKPDHPNAKKNGYIYEHRYVMAENLGRTLMPSEAVHHLNGNKQDNRRSNLLLVDSQHKHNVAHNPNLVNPNYSKEYKRRWRLANKERLREREREYKKQYRALRKFLGLPRV